MIGVSVSVSGGRKTNEQRERRERRERECDARRLPSLSGGRSGELSTSCKGLTIPHHDGRGSGCATADPTCPELRPTNRRRVFHSLAAGESHGASGCTAVSQPGALSTRGSVVGLARFGVYPQENLGRHPKNCCYRCAYRRSGGIGVRTGGRAGADRVHNPVERQGRRFLRAEFALSSGL